MLATSAGSSELTITLRLFDVKPAASDTFVSKPSVLTGAIASDSSCVDSARSTVGSSRTVSVAEFAG